MTENELIDGGSGELPVEVICGFPVHPAASLYPLVEGEGWGRTLASIRKEMKVQEPVVFQNGVLLDGRNRLRAVELIEKETGAKVSWEPQEFKPEWGDVIDWIENRNSHRRNLTVDQLAVIAVELYGIRESQAAAERKKQSQFGSQTVPKVPPQAVTTEMVSPANSGDLTSADSASEGKTKIRLRHPTTAAIIAEKAGQGVKGHHVSSVFKIKKELGPDARQDIRFGKKTISQVMKTIPKPPKPTLSLKQQVEKGWEKFKKPFAEADLPEVRRLLAKIIGDEKSKMVGKGGSK